MKIIRNNWQGFVFSAVGFFSLYHFYIFLQEGKVTEAGVVFSFAFLSFLYANLSRFKRFSGLGFEAELWEDKQKEAADLIARLENVVTIYTAEAVMSKITEGRFADKDRWTKVWTLYSALIDQHKALGQKIDFSDLKSRMDTYFLFDMCMSRFGIQGAIMSAHNQADAVIREEFGSPITDIEGHGRRLEQLRQIDTVTPELWAIAQRENLAAWLRNFAEHNAKKMKEYFGIEIPFDHQEMLDLARISLLWNHRPVPVTDETITLASRD
ncbi:hypothetical protein [Agrobacterium rosae]|uniref:Uncharacterized protein n=1 Tax=Agrobacterium rosae TaxID=1972867 RepID=A0A1R3TS72_9HYPH|nr:hypothetical protein [Agrobacterium rosae]SCX27400.1 hypothetical protein DSM25559_2994 [Agrobacterium rosae]